jgi:SAM-dependent methyltransferase
LQESSLRLTFRRFLEVLKREGMTSGRLLEIGSGYGYFLAEARDFFDDLYGIELSPEAAKHAQRLSGATVYAGDLSALSPELRGLDIIVAINVIEHVYEPVKFLLSLRGRLREGGRIIIATPDMGSFWYTILRKRWPSFKIPEHVAFYTEDTLTRLLHEVGLCHTKRLPFPHAFPLGVIAGKLGMSVPKRLRDRPVWLLKAMTALSARRSDG